MLIYADSDSILEGRFGSILGLFSYTFSTRFLCWLMSISGAFWSSFGSHFWSPKRFRRNLNPCSGRRRNKVLGNQIGAFLWLFRYRFSVAFFYHIYVDFGVFLASIWGPLAIHFPSGFGSDFWDRFWKPFGPPLAPFGADLDPWCRAIGRGRAKAHRGWSPRGGIRVGENGQWSRVIG